MTVRDDILPEELTQEQAIVVQQILNPILDNARSSRLTASNEEARLRQPKPAQDVDGFTDLIMTVIEEQQESEQVEENKRVLFQEDFPPGDITTEVITFGLLRREPGSFSRGQPFNGKVHEVKPHIRGLTDDPQNPGYKVITMGQLFDNELVFTCWAKTNKQANIRARWLEDTLRNWTWFVRYNGIQDFYFIGQDEDIALKLDGTENVLMGRPLRYFVRTERLSTILEPTIRRIVVKYGLGQS